MLRDSLDRNVSAVRSAKLAKGWGEGEAQAGSGSEKSVRADQDKANSGGAPGELKRIDLNDSNRPVRTRKPGGVGGGATPLSRFSIPPESGQSWWYPFCPMRFSEEPQFDISVGQRLTRSDSEILNRL